MAPVLAAIITLIGTLTIGAIGFWQWQRTQSASERKEYRAKRVETLKVLWEALNKIEEDQRAQLKKATNRQLQQEQTREVNLLLMKSAPFLFDDEREWCISIVQSIIEIDTAIRMEEEEEEEGGPDLDWWYATMAPPVHVTATSVAADRLITAREALGTRYAAVMRGEHD